MVVFCFFSGNVLFIFITCLSIWSSGRLSDCLSDCLAGCLHGAFFWQDIAAFLEEQGTEVSEEDKKVVSEAVSVTSTYHSR